MGGWAKLRVCVCVCVRVFRSSVLSLLRFASISLKAKISSHEQSAAYCNVEGVFLNNNIAEAATMCNIPLVFKIRVKKCPVFCRFYECASYEIP